MGYQNDIRLELKFARQIKMILGGVFIQQDAVADLKHATDFLVFTISPIKVAARLRTFNYLAKYPEQFTVRWSRPNGVPTEIDKIRNGLVDYMFYGFVDEQERNIIRWFVGNLSIFRQREPRPFEVHLNFDHSSELAAYGFWQFPETFFVHKHFPETAQLRLIPT